MDTGLANVREMIAGELTDMAGENPAGESVAQAGAGPAGDCGDQARKESRGKTSPDEQIRACFQLPAKDPRSWSPLVLAYIGDSIYDLVIRTIVVGEGNRSANKLHKKTSSLVCARAQSAMIEYLLPFLTEEEESIYRRGRNAKSPTTAKNQTVADYRRATGFEALLGHLYLTDRFDRVLDLVKIGLSGMGYEG